MAGLRKALIVANDEYEHEGLKHLLAPAADAQALAGVLGDTQIGDFEVQVVRNEPAHVIEGQIEDLLSDSRPDDVLLLHFSCHGLKSESGELFFAARNTRPNRLGSTAISADFVQQCMRASRSRSIVLLLDCCYGGAFSQGVTVRASGDVNVLDSFPSGKLGGGRGRAVITASSAMEYAFEGEQLADDHSRRPSVFTSALVEGLATGDADRDQDGWVSLNELYEYVFDRVREQNPHQTPSRDVEMQGELYLARRARPVTTPAPLPPELQEVIDHPLAGIRAGAVGELARLLQGRHAGLALAARLALERLAGDDSRAVAAAATAALSAPAQPAPTEPTPPRLALSATVVDFGRLPKHSKSPERRVRLGNAGGGHLNARPATQASWLELRQVRDELVLGVDTAAVGEHEGTVTVDSDGGSATIRVQARVDPKPLPAAEPATTPRPDVVPEIPEGARPGAQQDASLSTAAPAQAATAPPITATAPTPTTPASGALAGPTIGATLPPTGRTDLDRSGPPTEMLTHRRSLYGRRLLWVTTAAIALAVAGVVTLLTSRMAAHEGVPVRTDGAATSAIAPTVTASPRIASQGQARLSNPLQGFDLLSGQTAELTKSSMVWNDSLEQLWIFDETTLGAVKLGRVGFDEITSDRLRQLSYGQGQANPPLARSVIPAGSVLGVHLQATIYAKVQILGYDSAGVLEFRWVTYHTAE